MVVSTQRRALCGSGGTYVESVQLLLLCVMRDAALSTAYAKLCRVDARGQWTISSRGLLLGASGLRQQTCTITISIKRLQAKQEGLSGLTIRNKVLNSEPGAHIGEVAVVLLKFR